MKTKKTHKVSQKARRSVKPSKLQKLGKNIRKATHVTVNFGRAASVLVLANTAKSCAKLAKKIAQ